MRWRPRPAGTKANGLGSDTISSASSIAPSRILSVVRIWDRPCRAFRIVRSGAF